MKKTSLEEITYLNWEETERGWGTRPGGCSLHLSEEDSKRFVQAYWDGMPDSVPDEYSRPTSTPSHLFGKTVKAYVSNRLYKQIKASKRGIRLWRHEEDEAVKNKDLAYGKERHGWG